MLILPGYRLDKSTGSQRERKKQTFAINKFKAWHINDPHDKAWKEHSTYTAEHIETFLSDYFCLPELSFIQKKYA